MTPSTQDSKRLKLHAQEPIMSATFDLRRTSLSFGSTGTEDAVDAAQQTHLGVVDMTLME